MYSMYSNLSFCFRVFLMQTFCQGISAGISIWRVIKWVDLVVTNNVWFGAF
jgi:hypothetical protein